MVLVGVWEMSGVRFSVKSMEATRPAPIRLSPESYLAHLHQESRRFRHALAACSPTDPVPSCPAWTAADLAYHLTEVQHFWRHVITTRPNPPDGYIEPPRAEDYVDQLSEFKRTSKAFLKALRAAEAGQVAWSWASEQTVGFTYRRQALEALVHRIDAEQTAGLESIIDPELAADGVHEVLDIHYGGKPAWGAFSPLAHYVRIDLDDTRQSLWVQLGRFSGERDGEHVDVGDFAVVSAPKAEPDAVISGSASELLTRLWRRGDGHNLHVSGDQVIVDHFRQLTHAPLN